MKKNIMTLIFGGAWLLSATVLAQVVATDVACPSPCIQSTEILSNAVLTKHIKDGVVSNIKLAVDAVNTTKILDKTILDADISDVANISSAKINDGVGSGLDADLLDGLNSDLFLRSDSALNMTNSITTMANMAVGTSDVSGYNFKVHGTSAMLAPAHNAWALFGINTKGNVNWQLGNWDNDVSALGLSDADNNRNILLLGAGNSYLNGGNVGIGTADPNNKLHVIGGAYFRDVDGTFIPGGALVDWNGLRIAHDDAVNSTFAVGVNVAVSRSNPAIAVRNNSGPALLVEAGNVGIGTTTPSEKLDVAGNVNVLGNIQLAGNITSSGDICIGKCD